jgi:hypothetical protein
MHMQSIRISLVVVAALILVFVACNLGYDPTSVELTGGTGDLGLDQDQGNYGEAGLCANFIDDDADGAIDCADSECWADMACIGGGRPTGTACESHAGCISDANDPFCIIDWTDGYCSEFCTSDGSGCSTDNVCTQVAFRSEFKYLCLQHCDSSGDTRACRTGYQCIDLSGTGTTVCAP